MVQKPVDFEIKRSKNLIDIGDVITDIEIGLSK
jgi:hypothetical protein